MKTQFIDKLSSFKLITPLSLTLALMDLKQQVVFGHLSCKIPIWIPIVSANETQALIFTLILPNFLILEDWVQHVQPCSKLIIKNS